MAIVTKRLGTIGDSFAEIDYDDVTLIISVLRVVNNNSYPIRITFTTTATAPNPGRTVTRDFPGNSSETFNIPTGAANRLVGYFDSRGRLDGIDTSMVGLNG